MRGPMITVAHCLCARTAGGQTGCVLYRAHVTEPLPTGVGGWGAEGSALIHLADVVQALPLPLLLWGRSLRMILGDAGAHLACQAKFAAAGL